MLIARLLMIEHHNLKATRLFQITYEQTDPNRNKLPSLQLVTHNNDKDGKNTYLSTYAQMDLANKRLQ